MDEAARLDRSVALSQAGLSDRPAQRAVGNFLYLAFAVAEERREGTVV
jgi:hypothetical protein